MKRHRSRAGGRGDRAVQVAMDRSVLGYIATELAKSPQVEEGGKYLGYLLPSGGPKLQTLGLDLGAPALVVTDFLSSGPNAVRTAVELLPDGEYQERLFRQVERLDSEVEHLGTWHSHHCNGLQTFSGADVDGYHRTVNKAAYRPDYFLASLVTRVPRDPSDHNWIDHYLFKRGAKEYYRINELIKIINWPTRFGEVTGHSIETSGRGLPRYTGGDATPVPSAPSGIWYDTARGRETLAADKRFFSERFNGDVKATRHGERITITGRMGRVTISMTYPSDPGTSQVAVSVSRDDTITLEINSELQWRRLAMSAALAAAAELM